MTCIRINVNSSTNEIRIRNDGEGIPVREIGEDRLLVPTLVFGHLLSSSNYDDAEFKTAGGRNGVGAKLANIFSHQFTINTSHNASGHSFSQTWRRNMSESGQALVGAPCDSDFTEVIFEPDLGLFGEQELSGDLVALMHRRAFDVAALMRGRVTVHFNDVSPLPVTGLQDYTNLLEPAVRDSVFLDCGGVDCSWQLAVAASTQGDALRHISFVNGLHTPQGGTHLSSIVDQICQRVMPKIAHSHPQLTPFLRPSLVASCLFVLLDARVHNPTFESQCKERLTLPTTKFRDPCLLPETFIDQLADSGLIQSVVSKLRQRASNEQKKMGKLKQLQMSIPKLKDANFAGTKSSGKCTLILTEGESAKSLVLAGLSEIGSDLYGVYPLRGKVLNVSGKSLAEVMRNEELGQLVTALGLTAGMKYDKPEERSSLRYGRVMLMTDQDPDGSHIKGLVVNMLHEFWPDLLRADCTTAGGSSFVCLFTTPLLKVFRRPDCVLSFFSWHEFEAWRATTPDCGLWRVKYYKGLGTSTNEEAKEYFRHMDRHTQSLTIGGVPANDTRAPLQLAFDKALSAERRDWIRNWEDGVTNQEAPSREAVLDCDSFVHRELVVFSSMDNERKIPHLMDGLKPSQRKVLYTCLKRNQVHNEVKVAQLSGAVAELTAYHHGEESLNATIIKMAQTFVGSNNINLLEPIGQFGSRLEGGNDCAAARYIHTRLSSLVKVIFHPADEGLLKFRGDAASGISNNGDEYLGAEPLWYAPVIPMVLVNGAYGIGTGWKCCIPNYNPLHIIANVRRFLLGEPLVAMTPWYRGFRGKIELVSPSVFSSCGLSRVIGPGRVEVTELPVQVWTEQYKARLRKYLMVDQASTAQLSVRNYTDHGSDTNVGLLLYVNNSKLKRLSPTQLTAALKLRKQHSAQFVLFDENLKIKQFSSPEAVLTHFCGLRLALYEERRRLMGTEIRTLQGRLQAQIRFIQDILSGALDIQKLTDSKLSDTLLNMGYEPCLSTSDGKKEGNRFRHLTEMPIRAMTSSNISNLEATLVRKQRDLLDNSSSSAHDMWLHDLNTLEKIIRKLYDS